MRHEAIWPHSINAQFASASKHTLQASSEDDADSIGVSDCIDLIDDSIIRIINFLN